MKRLAMRKIRDALRLHAGGLSTRKIAASLGVGQSTASDYLMRVQLAGLTWPLATEMTDAALEALLFHPIGGPSRLVEAQPDWPAIHRELKRPGVTLSLLWEEYRAVHPSGYGYSRFCDLYRRWSGRLTPVMRQHHVAGERLFVATAVPHFLPELYPDPHVFDIDRYGPDRREHVQRGAFAPFGAGVHACLGARFAQSQMLVTLATLLRLLDLEIDPPSYRLRVRSNPVTMPVGLAVRVRGVDAGARAEGGPWPGFRVDARRGMWDRLTR